MRFLPSMSKPEMVKRDAWVSLTKMVQLMTSAEKLTQTKFLQPLVA